MKCTYLGYNPNLGEEFMQRLEAQILGEEFIKRLEAILANRPCVSLHPSLSSAAEGPADSDAMDSILKVKKLMYKTIQYEEQGRLLSIDSSLPQEIQVKLRTEIREQARLRRLGVFKRLAEAQAVQCVREGLSEGCPQNVQDLSSPDAGKDA